MRKLEKKLARNKYKKIKKKAKKDIAQQLTMFDKISDRCITCSKSFDKKSKEHAMTWKVVVKKENVFLFCPVCVENLVKKAEAQKNEDS